MSGTQIAVQSLVVTSGLTSADVRVTSGLRSPDEDDEDAGSITRLRFVLFTSNFVNLPPRKPLRKQGMSRIPLSSIFYPKFLSDVKA